LEESDRAWRSARQRGKGVGLVGEFSSHREHADALTVNVPSCNTADLGSVLRFRFSSPKDALPAEPPRVFWQTSKAPGISAWRRRLPLITPQETTSTAVAQFILEFDLSREPGWLSPDATVLPFRIESPGADKWELIATEFSDAPGLAP
jgi:hypothetical protein